MRAKISSASALIVLAEAPLGLYGSMGRRGATVIWTRHRRPPDLTPAIRGWFTAAGCTSLGFWSGGPGGFGVGAELREGPTRPLDRSHRLFAFTEG